MPGPARLIQERNIRNRRRALQGNTALYQGWMAMQAGAFVGPPVAAAASAAFRVVGLAETSVSSIGQADGAVPVDLGTGCYAMMNDPADPLTVADTGAPCYATDYQTVAKTNGGNTKALAGTVADVDDMGVWVRFA